MAKAADSCLTGLYEYALPPWDLPMSNLQNRIYTHYLAVKQLLISRRWIKSSFGIALAILVITALISAIGSQVDTQAASGPGLANDLPLDRSKLPLDFQFIGQGRITGGAEGTWIIGDIPIRVDGGSILVGDLHVGDFVTLSGRILGQVGWLADRIELAQEGASFFTFNGPLEQQKGSLWRVGGRSVMVDSGTALDPDLKIDDLVLVTFTVLGDNTWLATEIRAFDATIFEPTPTPEPTKAPPKKAVPTPAPAVVPNSNQRIENRKDEDKGKQEHQKKDKKDHKQKGKGHQGKKNDD
jgi:hypothetical protein